MFIAFAMEVPNVMFLFMFFIPVKAKWLAVIDFVYIAGTVVCGYLSYIVDIPYTVGYFGIGRTPAEATGRLIHGLLRNNKNPAMAGFLLINCKVVPGSDYCNSRRSSRRNLGAFHAVTPATPKIAKPPTMTAGTSPSSLAMVPA